MSPGHLRRLGAALQRTADRHAPRWASETLEHASAVQHSAASAAPEVQSGHAAPHSNLFSGLSGHQQRAGMHSRPPLRSSLRASGLHHEVGVASRGASSQLVTSRLVLASALLPAAHVMHSAVTGPSGCGLADPALTHPIVGEPCKQTTHAYAHQMFLPPHRPCPRRTTMCKSRCSCIRRATNVQSRSLLFS